MAGSRGLWLGRHGHAVARPRQGPAALRAAHVGASQLSPAVAPHAGLPTYPWAVNCSETVPSYVCITSDDPEFDRKFYGEGGSPEEPAPDGIKALLEAALSGRDPVPCKVRLPGGPRT